MIEQILTRKNLLQAMYKVQRNHGSAGVDYMPVTKLSELLSIDKEELTGKVRSGRYLPQPILGVEIPKGNGKTRLLGIPTVTDRLLQQAVLQVMMPRFEYEFSESSFGYRPNKNVGQAVMKAQGYINDGFQYIVDIDLIPIAIGTTKLTIACYCNCFTAKSNARKPCALSANGCVPRFKSTGNWSNAEKACHRVAR
jgi:retron-type reverse transcriptase